MNILLNNNKETLDFDSLTITELLKIKSFSFRMLVIKVNDKLIKKDEYPTTIIKDGDEVIVLHLISGG
jgi:thiamine biosynthesis protein ThiS